MKLTKRKALEICRDLWKWLSKRGRSFYDKESWSGWKQHGKMVCDCPCCEYEEQHSNRKLFCLEDCLIKWPGGDCESDDSPYENWKQAATVQKRKKLALEIVALVEEALKQLPKANKKNLK
jgi:hypothetical protein